MSNAERTRRRGYSPLLWALRQLVVDYTPARRSGPVRFTNGSAIMRTRSRGMS